MNLSTILDGAENECDAAERALIACWADARPLESRMTTSHHSLRLRAATAWAKEKLAEVTT